MLRLTFIAGLSILGLWHPAFADTKALGTGSPPPPSAIIHAVSIDDMVKVLQDSGYRAEIAQGSRRPYIKTGIGGRKIEIYFYDCEQKDCKSYQFSLLFYKSATFDLKFANAWNYKKRFTKAYLNDKGEMLFEWDIGLAGGVAPEYLKESVLRFERFVGLFDNFKPDDE